LKQTTRIMTLKQKFSDQDLDRIKEAVKQAEDRISGEIVPVIVERSGQYTLANYRSALLAAAFTFVVTIILDRYIVADASYALYYDPLFVFVVVALGGILGGLLPNYVGGLKRMLVGQVQLDYATRQRAENVFLEEEVFNTRHRTGIMIFISFFEHEVIVIADRGISKVVEQKQWDKIVSGLIGSIRAGKIVDGMEVAIKRCGEILLEKGFQKTDDDINELRDDLRIDQ
jgi:putative membrane protein